MVNKTPAELISGTPNDNSVVHSSEDGTTDSSKKHNERSISRLQGTAPLFSVSKTYDTNDLVTEAGIVYRANQNIGTPGAFIPAEWDQVGNLRGPASAIDNSIARFDGITGELIQDSNATIDDTDNIENIGSLQFADVLASPTVNTFIAQVNSDLEINVTGPNNITLKVGDTSQMQIQSTGIDFLSNNLSNLVLNSSVTVNTSITWNTGIRQIFNPNGVNSGLNVGESTGDPSSGVDGDIYYQSGVGFRGHIEGSWFALAEFFGPWTADHNAGAFDLINLNAISDSAGNEILGFTSSTTPVNFLTANSADTGVAPTLGVGGVAADIDIDISGRGTGTVNIVSDLVLTGPTTFPEDIRQIFNPGSTNAGINVGLAFAIDEPSNPNNGDMYYDNTNDRFRVAVNDAWQTMGDVVTGVSNTDVNELVRYADASGKLLANAANNPVTLNGAGVFQNVRGFELANRTGANEDVDYMQTHDNQVEINVGLTSTLFEIEFVGVDEYIWRPDGSDWETKNMDNIGFLTFDVAKELIDPLDTEFWIGRDVGTVGLTSNVPAGLKFNFTILGETILLIDPLRLQHFNPTGKALFELVDLDTGIIVGDNIGAVEFRALNDASANVEYSKIETKARDIAAGTHDGELEFHTAVNGSSKIMLTLNKDAADNAVFGTGVSVEIDDFVNFSEITTPTTPAANDGRLYIKDINGTSDLFFLDDAGTEKHFRPIADNTFYISTQAQLEAALGVDLEIPDDTKVTINLLGNITLTKGFKLGSLSSLWITSIVVNPQIFFDPTVTTDPLFSNTTPGVPHQIIRLIGIGIVDITGAPGSTTSKFVDLTGVNTGAVILSTSQVTVVNFNDLGTIENGVLNLEKQFYLNFSKGFIFKDILKVVADNVDSIPFTASTFISIIGSNAPILTAFGMLPGGIADSSILFIDPAVTSASIISVRDNAVPPPAELFQQGTDITVDSAALGTSGAGFTNFTTAAAHGLVAGQVTVNSTFADSAYNGTFVVVSVDTPLTGTVYEVEATFTATGAGIMNEASLQSTDLVVSADDNLGFKDSLAAGEVNQVNTVSFTATGGGTFDPIQDDTPTAGDFAADPSTERFTIDTSTGEATYVGLEPLTCIISYQVVLDRDGGSAQDVTVAIRQNTGDVIKTEIFNALVSSGTPVLYVYVSGLFDVETSDTFQLVADVETASRVITATSLNMVVREA